MTRSVPPSPAATGATAPMPAATGATMTALESLCATAQLSDEARGILGEVPPGPPADFVRALVEREQFADAVRLIAHALPRREAVWWAWVCARRSAGASPPPAIAGALDAVERWIAQPDDANRRTAMKAAEEADIGTPAGCAGLAAFFSGGSIAPPDAPAMPPAEHISARAVAGSVVLAAVVAEPELAAEKFRAYVQQGLDVADRTGAWAAITSRG